MSINIKIKVSAFWLIGLSSNKLALQHTDLKELSEPFGKKNTWKNRCMLLLYWHRYHMPLHVLPATLVHAHVELQKLFPHLQADEQMNIIQSNKQYMSYYLLPKHINYTCKYKIKYHSCPAKKRASQLKNTSMHHQQITPLTWYYLNAPEKVLQKKTCIYILI